MTVMKRLALLLPFWLFVFFFKFGGALHYAMLSWLGVQVYDVALVGILVGAGSLIQLILDVPTGFLVDRFGQLKVLRVGTFIFIFSGAVLLFGLSPEIYLVTLALATIGWLTFGPGTASYVLASAGKDSGGRYMGLYSAIGSLGVVLASLTLVFVMKIPVPWIGLIVAVAMVLATIALFFSNKTTRSIHEEKNSHHHHHYVHRHYFNDLLKGIRKLNPAFGFLAAQYLVGSIFYASIWFVLPLVIGEKASGSLLGLGLSIFDISVVILGAYLGRLADRLGYVWLIFSGLLLFAIMATATGLGLGLWFLVFGFLATAGDELAAISLWSWVNRLDSKHNQDGTLSGIVVLFGDLGYTIGPVLAGFLYGPLGPGWTIAICASPIFILWLVYSFLSIPWQEALSNYSNLAKERVFRFRHKS